MMSNPPSQHHKNTIRMDDAAKRIAREEMASYREQRDPLREALDQIEQKYRSLPKRGK